LIFVSLSFLSSSSHTRYLHSFPTRRSSDLNPMTIIGGNNAFAVINAPNSDLTFKGNSNFYGQAIGKTVDVQGNGHFYWDKALVTPPPDINPLYEISLRELSY